MEISILLVDDDKILVDKLQETVQWEKIGISMVFTACNIRQAQKQLEEFPIQMILCDIDMPQGSGLELLEWVRSRKMDVECVFLSSYANFAYAQKAMRLSTREYLLKPISNQDLEAALMKVVAEVKKKYYPQKNAGKSDSKAELWENFFGTPTDQKRLLRQAIEDGSYQEEDILYLETIRIFADNKDINYKKDLSLFNFVIRNITAEFFEKKNIRLEAVVPVSDYEWALIFQKSQEEDKFLESSLELKAYLDSILSQRSCMYISLERPVCEMPESWRGLEIMEKKILPGENGVLLERDFWQKPMIQGKEFYETPPWEVWQKALENMGGGRSKRGYRLLFKECLRKKYADDRKSGTLFKRAGTDAVLLSWRTSDEFFAVV